MSLATVCLAVGVIPIGCWESPGISESGHLPLLPLLALGGRDVVIEAEEVVRIVAPLYLPQPLELRIP